MSDSDELGLDEAYAVKTPDDSRRLYGSWATTYDGGFIEKTGYVYHRKVAEIFTDDFDDSGIVLDVGCGTGAVGVELQALGVSLIDGVDISPEMLVQARSKGVYRSLFEADLTGPVAVEDDRYTGVVSAGTFTHGHLPADSLGELVRICAPGARGAIGVNSAHFEDLGFRRWLDEAVHSGTLTAFELVVAPVYENSSPESRDDMSEIVVFEVA